MDFRLDARDLHNPALAEGTLSPRCPPVLRLPLIGLGLLLAALLAATLLRADERTRGAAVVRVPETTYLRAAAQTSVEELHVHEGEAVAAGQVLASLAAPELDRALALAVAREREALIASLRSPRDTEFERGLERARSARVELEAERRTFELRAPRSGRIASLRADPGARLEAGDIVVSLAPVHALPVQLRAYFPGPGQIEIGASIRVDFGQAGARAAPVWFRVEAVSHDWIRPNSPRAMTQLEGLSDTEGRTGSVLVVRAVLESAPPDLALRDGMIGEAQLIVRERSLLRRALEDLGFVHPAPLALAPESQR